VAAFALLAACAQVKSHLPPRGEKPRPVATAPAKPRPPPTTPATPATTTASGFVVLDPAHLERDRGRVRQALAAADRDALAAADVGYYLDVLQGRLRQLAGTRAAVARRGQHLSLDLSRAVAFEPGGPRPGPAADAMLAPLGKLLAEYRQVLATVRVGVADAASGNDPRVAQARAVEIAKALADAGVAKPRIVVVGTTGARAGAGPRVEVQLDPVVRAAAVRAPAR
jgi:outer membrane protein OmpA-like peptidoglycan-associated protein